MFNLLKYTIFAIGLLTIYMMINIFITDRGELQQTVSDNLEQKETTMVSKLKDIGQNIKEASETINKVE